MRFQNLVDNHKLASFLAVTYLFTWSIQAGISLLNMEPSWTLSVLVGLGGFGPLVGAAFVIWITGNSLKKWISQAFRWKVGKKWWVAALGLPLVILVLGSVLFMALGGPVDVSALPPIWVFFFVLAWGTVWGGGQEELGWRGFMLPMLQEKYSALTSSLFIGVAWALWHLPLFLNPNTTHGAWPIGQQVLWVTTILAGSILWTWMYNNTVSALLVAVFHAGINTMGVFHPADVDALYPGGVPDQWLTLLAEGTSAVVLIGAAILVLIIYGWKRLSYNEVPGKEHIGLKEKFY